MLICLLWSRGFAERCIRGLKFFIIVSFVIFSFNLLLSLFICFWLLFCGSNSWWSWLLIKIESILLFCTVCWLVNKLLFIFSFVWLLFSNWLFVLFSSWWLFINIGVFTWLTSLIFSIFVCWELFGKVIKLLSSLVCCE